ncbi:hypothetical protein ACIGXI_22440 [Kitasatospora aureofaciens]|uniref:hypothetical protein n=1 Tax=Kitasatospora aureofaciens TaxID=1894 RepID=UPI0037C8BBD9
MSLGLALAAVLTGVGAHTAAAAPATTAPAPTALTSSACPADLLQGEADGCVTRLQPELELNLTGARITVDGQFGPAPARPCAITPRTGGYWYHVTA